MDSIDKRAAGFPTSILRTAVVALLSLAASVALAAPPPDLDTFTAKTMQAFEVPGMALAIVEPGREPLTKGYGVRKLGSPARVDEHTLFAIASNTKAFTTTALAMLVDEGKLRWDDKVIDRLPGFRMYDAFSTHEMTLLDLLTHRSGLGLGAGDLMFWPRTTLTREQIVERLRFIAPATSFRSGYAYDNVLYVVAGAVVSANAGQSWDSFIQKRIFEPLGMRDSVPSFQAVKTENRSWPHMRLGVARGIGPMEAAADISDIDNEAPAGGIHSSAADMSKWIRLQLDRGKWGNDRLFSEAVAAQLWTPRVNMPIDPAPAPIAQTTPNFDTYALGWVIRDYRGHKLVMHEGMQEGAISVTVLIPEKQVGFIIMLNSEDGEPRWAIAYRLLDHYLALPRTDWIAAFTEVRKQRIDDAMKVLKNLAQPNTAEPAHGPSLSLEKYAATYRDPWYGNVIITHTSSGLNIRFENTPHMEGVLEHVRYDTFRTRFVDRRMEDTYVTFSLQPDGSIERVKMKAISPLADFSFDYHDLSLTPVASP